MRPTLINLFTSRTMVLNLLWAVDSLRNRVKSINPSIQKRTLVTSIPN